MEQLMNQVKNDILALTKDNNLLIFTKEDIHLFDIRFKLTFNITLNDINNINKDRKKLLTIYTELISKINLHLSLPYGKHELIDLNYKPKHLPLRTLIQVNEYSRKFIISGNIRLLNKYFSLPSNKSSYFNPFLLDVNKEILIKLNHLDFVVFLNVFFNDNDLDDHFENIVYMLTKSNRNAYYLLKTLMDKINNEIFNWKHMYLLAFNYINPLYLDFALGSDDFDSRESFQENYPDLYQELIKYEKLNIPSITDRQFYLNDFILGFNWKRLFNDMDRKDIIGMIIFFEGIAEYDDIEIDIIKLLTLLEKYIGIINVAYHYIRETCNSLAVIKNKNFYDNGVKILQYLYNKMGYHEGLNIINDVNLFKWFRGLPGDYEIKNTFGPDVYTNYDIDELFHVWSSEYSDDQT